MSGTNPLLDLFRVNAALLMAQYADRMRVFVTENRLMGLTNSSIRRIRETDLSKWTFERGTLEKQIKKEVGGLINKIFQTAYMDGLGTKGKAK